ncbi:MAG TPA: SUMF1/EgtB/PvdO family nonheme iron enzyme, partial [Anseongella sp.]|nr:SUMF1/EgtB/PvdO family nonheme iron enzyme [Anseongella sp.]
GSEVGHEKDEAPLHKVKLDPFWMGEHEVTWDIYELFVYKNFEAKKSSAPVSAEADAVTRPTKPYLDMTFGMGKEGHPALAMTQYGAIQFCKWLYKKTGVFYRLPTEAEWEYACRAGSETAYSFGDDPSQLGDYAWYAGNSGDKTHPVGSKKPNKWGLYDMHGNVMEWTMDQYLPDYYAGLAGKTAENPLAEPTELYPRVVRGGSFKNEAGELRSANRIPSEAAWKRIDPQVPKSNWWFPEAPFLGLRLVRPASPPSKEEIEAYYNIEPIPDL